jgi:hypothetical protein
MRYLGFGVVPASKGWFTDGHEREDVVKYRDTKFLPLMKELNYIELVWGWIKGYHRRNCTYNFADLENDLPSTMENEIPLATIQRYYRYCLRFMSGYRSGLTGVLLDYSVRKYKGHRAIPANIREVLGGIAPSLPPNIYFALADENEVRNVSDDD